nr:disease resistance-like protein csa1 [Quercus suber]
MILDELKLIDLSDSQNLIKTLKFSRVPNLKQLILQRCIRLSKIHASLGNLKWLIRLDLSSCKWLESLPPKVNMECLEIFILSGCSRLKKYPEVEGNMSSLSELYLNETAMKDLPSSMEHLTGLIKLDLRDCKNLSSLPNVCCYLMSLKILTLSSCSKINELPENLGNIKDGCTSLEMLPLRPEDGLYPDLYLLNCVKLINNEDYGDMLLTTLRHHIQFKGDEPIYHIIIPGREIPKWFRHQSVGTSMNFQVPSDKLKGVAMYAIFVLHQHHPLHSTYETSGGYIFMHRLQFYLKANRYESQSIPDFPFSEEFGKIESYHLYLSYIPYTVFDQELGQMEIRFKTKGPRLEVTICRAHWVYEQDIEDPNQTMLGCNSSNNCSITPYEDDLEDLAKDTKIE